MSTRNSHVLLGLDVGDRRIGVAQADSDVRVPFPLCTIDVDDLVVERLREVVVEVQPKLLVIGYPRNQSGEATAQTAKVVAFADRLQALRVEQVFQDESLTSVLAEQYLKSHKKAYTKADIDAHAAAIILGDYLEANYGR
ncbi:MAG TPA: Holliday junction resolvase RuvX [Candidatus Saccharimonadales bacterium]|jgi:putative Holliday junction resolvase